MRQVLLWLCSAFLIVSQYHIEAAHHDPNSIEGKKQIIGISLPGDDEPDYFQDLQNIADLAMEMDRKTKGLDYLLIVHDKTGKKYFGNYTFTNAHLIEVESPGLDLWMRDFPPVMPFQQVNFTYRPQYLGHARARQDKAGFTKFAKLVGLPKLNQSDIVMEGGNAVENGKNIAVTTARIYKDNPGYTQDNLVQELESKLSRTVVVLPDPLDTTGHSDGLVSFVEEDTLLVSLFDDADGQSYYDAIEAEVLKKFPNLKVFPLPCYSTKNITQGFMSSEGAYANSLVTNNAVYLPFYSNETANQMAYAAFQNHTTKTVVSVVNTRYIPGYGGSVRCMTWQVDQHGPVGKSLLYYMKNGPPNSAASVASVCMVMVVVLQMAILVLN